jgi:hypothetical protein
VFLCYTHIYNDARLVHGNFLLLRPYHCEHGPKVPVTPEYIVLQCVLQKRECMSILTQIPNKHADLTYYIVPYIYIMDAAS